MKPLAAPSRTAQRQPLPHQREAIAFLEKHCRAILADDMGLGKTAVAIMAARGKALIVCPAALKESWAREINVCRPGVPVCVLSGKLVRPIPAGADFVVVNYEILHAQLPALADFPYETIVVDEEHLLRNRTGVRYEAILAAAKPADRRFLLSGTPLVNRPLDLVAALEILGKIESVFGSADAFIERYCAPRMTVYGWDFSGATHLSDLREKLTAAGILFRREKAQVLRLPKQSRRIVFLAEPAANVMAPYRELETKYRAWGRANQGERHNPFCARLHHALGIAKLGPAIDWLRQNDSGLPRVVFARHIEVQRRIAEAFPGAVWLSATMTPRQRTESIARFQSGQFQMLVTSCQIGGVGLNLVAGREVVFIEYDFRADVHKQAEARVDRIGQTGETIAIYLHLAGTIDDISRKRLNRKDNIASRALGDERRGLMLRPMLARSK